MVKYVRKDSKNGRTMYFVDGKMTSPKKIDQEVLRDLQSAGSVTVPDENTPQPSAPAVAKPTDRTCLFCGKFGNFSKFINGITVYLCTDDYKGHTTGEVAQKMREEGLFNPPELEDEEDLV